MPDLIFLSAPSASPIPTVSTYLYRPPDKAGRVCFAATLYTGDDPCTPAPHPLMRSVKAGQEGAINSAVALDIAGGKLLTATETTNDAGHIEAEAQSLGIAFRLRQRRGMGHAEPNGVMAGEGGVTLGKAKQLPRAAAARHGAVARSGRRAGQPAVDGGGQTENARAASWPMLHRFA